MISCAKSARNAAAAGTLSNFPATAPPSARCVFINMQEYVLSHVRAFLRAKRLSRCLRMQILAVRVLETVKATGRRVEAVISGKAGRRARWSAGTASCTYKRACIF